MPPPYIMRPRSSLALRIHGGERHTGRADERSSRNSLERGRPPCDGVPRSVRPLYGLTTGCSGWPGSLPLEPGCLASCRRAANRLVIQHRSPVCVRSDSKWRLKLSGHVKNASFGTWQRQPRSGCDDGNVIR